MTGDVFHKAARDGYLDLLREATRKECNTQDEDGMTPTLWAAYHGRLDALRMLVGRGGNPDKCDYYGNTCLHHAAANGMLNCVTFLVSFGTNLWSLDNDFRTALDLAAIADREDVVKYLDNIYAKQSSLNPKLVKKWKEKSVLDAQKRTKKFAKLQAKALKRTQKEGAKLARSRELLETRGYPGSKSAPPSLHSGTVRSTKSLSSWSVVSSRNKHRDFSDPKPYSEHFTITSQNRKYFIGGVAKKLKQKSKEPSFREDGDFLVREISDGKRTVRSLAGLKRETQVVYMKDTAANGSISSNDSGHSPETDPVFMPTRNRCQPDGVSRAISEPDFYYNGDSGVDLTSSQDFTDSASIFERPGFGSVAFLQRPATTLRQMSHDGAVKEEPRVLEAESSHSASHVSDQSYEQPGVTSRRSRGLYRLSKKSVDDSLSIGTVGSLAVRIKDLSLQEEPVLLEDDEYIDTGDQNNLELFLAANGLSEYFAFFTREQIDIDALMFLTDQDLEKLGLKLGPRRKLLGAIARRKAILDSPGFLSETWL